MNALDHKSLNAPNPSPPADIAIRPGPNILPAAPAPNPTAAALPYWIPAGVQLERFPPEISSAIAEVINPAYQQLVLSAQPGLAQSTGLTIVHLLWLEIIDHLELAEQPPAWGLLDLPLPIKGSRESLIDRHLRLVGAKLKASDFLLRLKAFKSPLALGGLPRSLHVYDHVEPPEPDPPASDIQTANRRVARPESSMGVVEPLAWPPRPSADLRACHPNSLSSLERQ